MPVNLFSLSSVDCFVSMWLTCAKKFFSLQHTPKGILVHNVICSSNATRNVLENVCFLHERFLGSEIRESIFYCVCVCGEVILKFLHHACKGVYSLDDDAL